MHCYEDVELYTYPPPTQLHMACVPTRATSLERVNEILWLSGVWVGQWEASAGHGWAEGIKTVEHWFPQPYGHKALGWQLGASPAHWLQPQPSRSSITTTSSCPFGLGGTNSSPLLLIPRVPWHPFWISVNYPFECVTSFLKNTQFKNQKRM